jgi:uncharacterized coiled-coil protein SlyX
MPVKQSRKNKKSPPSQMIRVPTALIEAVRELARLHRAGYTSLILDSLQQLIANTDSKVDIDGDSVINQLAQRVSQLESHFQQSDITDLGQQLADISSRIQRLESAYNQLVTHLNSTGSKRQSSRQYQPTYTKAKLQKYDEENLASRLKVDRNTLYNMRTQAKTLGEFIGWSRGRDPSGLGWEYNENDGFYYPAQ